MYSSGSTWQTENAPKYRLLTHVVISKALAQLRGALDGSKCWVTVSDCRIAAGSPSRPLLFERCPLCRGSRKSDIDDCVGVPLPVGESAEKTRVCFRLGQAPDLSSDSLRGVLETVLQCVTVGTTVRVTAEVTEPQADSPVKFTFNARLDRLLLQPLFRPTPTSDEETNDKIHQQDTKSVQKPKEQTPPPSKEGPGSEGTWPAGLSRIWLERALALKARGTWLLTGSHKDASGDAPAFGLDRLDGAFRCYSRALRFVSLLGTLAHLPTKEGPDASPLMETIAEAPGAAAETEYVDLDKPTVCIKSMTDGAAFRVDMIVLSKLHISLLSNMALCQLKAGSNAFAVKQCTAALELVPSEAEHLKGEEDGDGITAHDVEKLLFRRGSAYAASDLLDEAHDDLTRVLQMNPANQPAKRLLEDVQRRLASVHNLMAERLRRAL